MSQGGVYASGAGVASELMSIQDQTEGCFPLVPRGEGNTSWFVLGSTSLKAEMPTES